MMLLQSSTPSDKQTRPSSELLSVFFLVLSLFLCFFCSPTTYPRAISSHGTHPQPSRMKVTSPKYRNGIWSLLNIFLLIKLTMLQHQPSCSHKPALRTTDLVIPLSMTTHNSNSTLVLEATLTSSSIASMSILASFLNAA